MVKIFNLFWFYSFKRLLLYKTLLCCQRRTKLVLNVMQSSKKWAKSLRRRPLQMSTSFACKRHGVSSRIFSLLLLSLSTAHNKGMPYDINISRCVVINMMIRMLLVAYCKHTTRIVLSMFVFIFIFLVFFFSRFLLR